MAAVHSPFDFFEWLKSEDHLIMALYGICFVLNSLSLSLSDVWAWHIGCAFDYSEKVPKRVLHLSILGKIPERVVRLTILGKVPEKVVHSAIVGKAPERLRKVGRALHESDFPMSLHTIAVA